MNLAVLDSVPKQTTVSNLAEDSCQLFIYLGMGWLTCFFTVVIGTKL